MGSCPKCEKPLMRVTIEDVEVSAIAGRALRGLNYLCPTCHAVVSVGIDPIALKADIVNEILQALGKRP